MATTLKLPCYNWQRDALVSICLAVMASIYSLTTGYKRTVTILWYIASLIFGIMSVFKQIKASKANVVNFDHNNWAKDETGQWVLTIESDFMLFRVEMPGSDGKYQEVLTGMQSDPDGKRSYISAGGSFPIEQLRGRVVIR